MKRWHIELADESVRTVEADIVSIRDQAFWFTKRVPESRHGITSELVALIPMRSVLVVEEIVEGVG